MSELVQPIQPERLSTNKYSLITILKHDLYPNPENIFENKSKTDQKQIETNNNDKNEKEYINTGKNPELGKLVRERFKAIPIALPDPKRFPIKYAWQEKAQRYAANLGLKFTGDLDNRWYKMFKEAAVGKNPKNIELAYSYIVDHPKLTTTEEKVKMFFWIFNHGLNYQLKKK